MAQNNFQHFPMANEVEMASSSYEMLNNYT